MKLGRSEVSRIAKAEAKEAARKATFDEGSWVNKFAWYPIYCENSKRFVWLEWVDIKWVLKSSRTMYQKLYPTYNDHRQAYWEVY